SASGRAWARSAANRVAERAGVERIDLDTLREFRHDASRTLHLFDVRDPDEYRAGHVAGAVSAPGGQLVQATDHYVGTLRARIVLVDDAEVRAVMTASWLRQIGYAEVFVLAESGRETTTPAHRILGRTPPPQDFVDSARLSELMARETTTIVDLSSSRAYAKSHIPGAWFAIRSRLALALAKIAPLGDVVLTSEDGI